MSIIQINTPESGNPVPELVRTADGSDTLFLRELNQHYHSTFGAVQESEHIFINAGFRAIATGLSETSVCGQDACCILEIGFGTGLNTFMTILEAEKIKVRIDYTAIDAHPIGQTCWEKLNYSSIFGQGNHHEVFNRIHTSRWHEQVHISPSFVLEKINIRLEEYIAPTEKFHLIYFDAFGPDAQPELWTEPIFRKLYNSLIPGGLIMTYSVKGSIVRAMQSAGFQTFKLPGPPGKRHILRGMKPLKR